MSSSENGLAVGVVMSGRLAPYRPALTRLSNPSQSCQQVVCRCSRIVVDSWNPNHLVTEPGSNHVAHRVEVGALGGAAASRREVDCGHSLLPSADTALPLRPV